MASTGSSTCMVAPSAVDCSGAQHLGHAKSMQYFYEPSCPSLSFRTHAHPSSLSQSVIVPKTPQQSTPALTPSSSGVFPSTSSRIPKSISITVQYVHLQLLLQGLPELQVPTTNFANFRRLLLGCIKADFCQANTHFAAVK